MEYRETDRLLVAKQVAYSRLLCISLNNHAACETNVEIASLDERSSRAEKIVKQLLLILLFRSRIRPTC